MACQLFQLFQSHLQYIERALWTPHQGWWLQQCPYAQRENFTDVRPLFASFSQWYITSINNILNFMLQSPKIDSWVIETPKIIRANNLKIITSRKVTRTNLGRYNSNLTSSLKLFIQLVNGSALIDKDSKLILDLSSIGLKRIMNWEIWESRSWIIDRVRMTL